MIVNSFLYDICPNCGETIIRVNGQTFAIEYFDEPAPEITATGDSVRVSVEKEDKPCVK